MIVFRYSLIKDWNNVFNNKVLITLCQSKVGLDWSLKGWNLNGGQYRIGFT